MVASRGRRWMESENWGHGTSKSPWTREGAEASGVGEEGGAAVGEEVATCNYMSGNTGNYPRRKSNKRLVLDNLLGK